MLRAEEGRKRSERRNKCRNFPSIYVYLILNNGFIISENNLQKKLTSFEWVNFLLRIFFVKLRKMFRNLNINALYIVNVYGLLNNFNWARNLNITCYCFFYPLKIPSSQFNPVSYPLQYHQRLVFERNSTPFTIFHPPNIYLGSVANDAIKHSV